MLRQEKNDSLVMVKMIVNPSSWV